MDLDLRPMDEKECALAGLSPREALASGKESTFAYAVEVDGEPVAFWGYSSETLLDDKCYAWLLTRPQIEKYKFHFARTSVRLISHIHESYREIYCLADEEYREATRWLLWLGFKPVRRLPEGLLMKRVK